MPLRCPIQAISDPAKGLSENVRYRRMFCAALPAGSDQTVSPPVPQIPVQLNSQQALIKREERFIYFINIIISTAYKIFYYQVEFA